ncbi:MAG: GTPase HflX, partial [Bacillales bacterium]|nr:GTPase HflX [Bacillales bacterium]
MKKVLLVNYLKYSESQIKRAQEERIEPDDDTFVFEKNNESLDDIISLVESATFTLVSIYNVKNRDYHKKLLSFFHLEKINEIIEKDKIDLVVFNTFLIPSEYNILVEKIKASILDYEGLLIEIFSQRINSQYAKIAIDLAKLKYQLPRLIDSNEGFDQQKGGVINRGSGEKQISLDRSRLRGKIAQLENKLEELHLKKIDSIEKLADIPLKKVVLVGYTNSGKSSLMNLLLSKSSRTIGKEVLVKDQLFASLDTSSRRVIIENMELLVTDTVGLISNMSQRLDELFVTTFSHIYNADLIIIVYDILRASEQQSLTIAKYMDIPELRDIPKIMLINKIDAMFNPPVFFAIPEIPENNIINFSVLEEEGYNLLVKRIREILYKDYVSLTLQI